MSNIRPTSAFVQVYGTDECKETAAVRRELNRENIAFEYVDVQLDLDAAQWIKSLTEGALLTPVIDLYGEILIQPSKERLGLVLRASDLRSVV